MRPEGHRSEPARRVGTSRSAPPSPFAGDQAARGAAPRRPATRGSSGAAGGRAGCCSWCALPRCEPRRRAAAVTKDITGLPGPVHHRRTTARERGQPGRASWGGWSRSPGGRHRRPLGRWSQCCQLHAQYGAATGRSVTPWPRRWEVLACRRWKATHHRRRSRRSSACPLGPRGGWWAWRVAAELGVPPEPVVLLDHDLIAIAASALANLIAGARAGSSANTACVGAQGEQNQYRVPPSRRPGASPACRYCRRLRSQSWRRNGSCTLELGSRSRPAPV